MTRLTRSTFKLFLPVLALCVAFGATPALAQSTYEANLRSQINTLLSSESPDMQKSGVDLVVDLATQEEPVLNPRSFRDRLFRIYLDTDGPEDLRIAAIDALEATGNNETAIKMIVKHLRDEPSQRVRQHTLAVLSKHNGVGRG